jgi:REP element-mobilizing transposase RayT
VYKTIDNIHIIVYNTIMENKYRHTNTTMVLRNELLELKKIPSLWTRSYFVSTAGNVCGETIKKYVENQKSRKRGEYLCLKNQNKDLY